MIKWIKSLTCRHSIIFIDYYLLDDGTPWGEMHYCKNCRIITNKLIYFLGSGMAEKALHNYINNVSSKEANL